MIFYDARSRTDLSPRPRACLWRVTHMISRGPVRATVLALLLSAVLPQAVFAAPLSAVARMWIRCYRHWRDSRTHRRRHPLRVAA